MILFGRHKNGSNYLPEALDGIKKQNRAVSLQTGGTI